jgi:hypothetical protein
MYAEDFWTGELIRVPRKIKKQAKKNGFVIMARLSRKIWLSA